MAQPGDPVCRIRAARPGNVAGVYRHREGDERVEQQRRRPGAEHDRGRRRARPDAGAGRAMRSFRDMNPYLVGIVSVIVLGALTGAAFGVGLLHLLEHTYDLRAEFTDASGLREGDAVRVAGVKVGRVTGIHADRAEGLVLVDFVVNQGVELGVDTTAEIALETLLGAKYIRLTTPLLLTEPYLGQLPSSDTRRTIPVDHTKTPFDVYTLTRVGPEGIQALNTKELNQMI